MTILRSVSRSHGLATKALVPWPQPASTADATGTAPHVSVIVPCYNYAHYLPQAVHSALDQPGVDVEVIIIDDASTDDSGAVAENLAADDARVRAIRLASNGGHVAAVNTGLRYANGEFIARLDADDLLTPGSLGRSVALLRAFPDLGLVYGRPRHFVDTPPLVYDTSAVRSWRVWAGQDWIAYRCRKGYNCITTPEVVMRASVLEHVGGIDPRLRIAEDMHWWLRIAAVSDVGRINGPDQALHRDHDRSLTAEVDKLYDLEARRLVFECFIADPGAVLTEAEALDLAWRRALAQEALQEVCRAFDRGRTASVNIEGFVDIARQLLPGGYEELPLWRAYQRRLRFGPRWAPLTPFAAAAIAQRRVAHETRYRRWVRTGL